jgi:hypothetical protein
VRDKITDRKKELEQKQARTMMFCLSTNGIIPNLHRHQKIMNNDELSIFGDKDLHTSVYFN